MPAKKKPGANKNTPVKKRSTGSKISSSKKASPAPSLKADKKLLQIVLDTSLIAIWTYDLTTDVVRWGGKAKELLGTSSPPENLDGYLAARQRDPSAMSLVVFRDGREQTLEFGLGDYQATEDELQTFFEEHESLVRLAIASPSTQTGSDTI